MPLHDNESPRQITSDPNELAAISQQVDIKALDGFEADVHDPGDAAALQDHKAEGRRQETLRGLGHTSVGIDVKFADTGDGAVVPVSVIKRELEAGRQVVRPSSAGHLR